MLLQESLTNRSMSPGSSTTGSVAASFPAVADGDSGSNPSPLGRRVLALANVFGSGSNGKYRALSFWRMALVSVTALLLLLVHTTCRMPPITVITSDGTREKTLATAPLTPDYVIKTQGNKWRLWNAAQQGRSDVENSDGILFYELRDSTSCAWTTFRPAHIPGLPPPHTDSVPICTYSSASGDGIVSRYIREQGRWADCDALSALAYHNGNALHVEVGANIGACILQVLLTTNATILAFEPAPTNLFILTHTLSALPYDLQRRVWLFPIALGDTTMQSTIHTAHYNRGNSMIGDRPVADNPGQEFLPPMPISVERLTDVLDWTKLPRSTSATSGEFTGIGTISSVKIDVQGYECSVVRGMLPILQSRTVRAVKFENEPKFLEAAASPCNSSMLFDLFTKPTAQGGAHFNVHLMDEGETIVGPRLEAFSDGVQDLIALPPDSTWPIPK